MFVFHLMFESTPHTSGSFKSRTIPLLPGPRNCHQSFAIDSLQTVASVKTIKPEYLRNIIAIPKWVLSAIQANAELNQRIILNHRSARQTPSYPQTVKP
jgi:hypothetical protein